MPLEKLLQAKEVCEIFQIDLPRLYSLVRENKFPHVLIGERQYRFSREAIEKFIADGGTRQKQNYEKTTT